MDSNSKGSGRWAIVLAGGEGERLKPFVERWLGASKPKQYCAFTGAASMLEHTWTRALRLVAPERLVTVIGRGHRAHMESFGASTAPGRIVEQPAKKETGPGVYLPLSYVRAVDPEAAVAIFPSDHFIHSNEAFSERMEEAFHLAENLPGQIVLMAAPPTRRETDYGWIQPRSATLGASRAFLARRFVEKPGAAEAARLMEEGALWNTMIVVARAAALWELAWQLRPSMMGRFEALVPHIGTPREGAVLEHVYDGMESSNFSKDILEKCADRMVVLSMDGVSWCDWGRPERILETLAELGRSPSFPHAIPRHGPSAMLELAA